MTLSYQAGQDGHLDTLNSKICPLFRDFSHLVPIFTTRGVAAALTNNPILLGRSRQSFRHLELQNLSIISYFRYRGHFGTVSSIFRHHKLCHLKIILSYWPGRDRCLDTSNSKIYPLFRFYIQRSFWHLKLHFQTP